MSEVFSRTMWCLCLGYRSNCCRQSHMTERMTVRNMKRWCPSGQPDIRTIKLINIEKSKKLWGVSSNSHVSEGNITQTLRKRHCVLAPLLLKDCFRDRSPDININLTSVLKCSPVIQPGIKFLSMEMCGSVILSKFMMWT